MRFSVQSKLLAGFGLVVCLMLVVGLFAVARLRADSHHLALLGSRVVPSTRTVGDINALMNKYRKDQLHYIVARPSDRPLGVPGSIAGDLRDDLSSMRELLVAYRSHRLVEDRRDARLLASFATSFSRYVQLTGSFRGLADEGRPLEAGVVVGDGPGDAQWDRLKAIIAAWNDHKVATAEAEARASYADYRFGLALIVALLTAAVATAAAIAVLLARRTTRSVREIGLAAKAIAEGEIGQRVPVRSRDELGEMARDFDAMIGYLRETVGVAGAIAEGNLAVEVRPRSPRDALGNALAAMTASLRALVAENGRLLATSRAEAHTDALTGLANRRALTRDLASGLARATTERPLVLALFDLDGFKQYNDTFGHSAGDALLVRLSERLRERIDGSGTPYRMGGDEFCLLALTSPNGGAALARQAADALSEHGEAFAIGCSYGVATLPREAVDAEEALRLADQRMYELKASRSSASRQSTAVLLKVIDERSPGLGTHINVVAELAVATAAALGLPDHECKRIRLAGELHDVGKVAIPDSILLKPGPLDPDEWLFIRRHTEIGARIVAAAPALAPTADLIRASHERYDGTGYPDGIAGDEIPLGARVIAACDAYDAMRSPRPYSDAVSAVDALAELRRCAGTQFDPAVVDALGAVLAHELRERAA